MKGHARDLMTTRVTRAYPETHLAELAELLVAGPYGGLPIVGPDDQVLGFVSETDVMTALLFGQAQTTRARDLMTSPAQVIDEFATTDDVIATLRLRRIHHLPVVRGDRLVGIISPGDVLRYFLTKLGGGFDAG